MQQPKFKPVSPRFNWRTIGIAIAVSSLALVLGLMWYFMQFKQSQAPAPTNLTPDFSETSVVEVSSASEATSQATFLYVDVKGAVKNPGVYRLPAGSRVLDALEAAGGVTQDAELNHLNRAQLVQDQQLIYVYTQAEWEQVSGQETQNPPLNSTTPDTAKSTKSALININQASATELQQLPGIGAKKAEAIVQYRQEHGSFAEVADLAQVSGIGPKLVQRLETLVTTK